MEEDLVKYRYILDWVQFRVPQKRHEYTKSYEDFDIAFTFKNNEMPREKAIKIIKFLKSIK